MIDAELCWWFTNLCNAFVFPYRKPTLINALYAESGIWGQIALRFFILSPVTSTKLIIFNKVFIYFL